MPIDSEATIPAVSAPRSASSAPPPLRNAAHCSSCGLRHFCMPQGLSTHDTARLETVINTARMVKRGEVLFRPGDNFDALYAIRSGSMKTTLTSANGREQVMGLHLGGDTIGLEAFANGHQVCQAAALEDSSVCVIPQKQFERACRENASIQRRLSQIMSAELVRKSAQILILGTLRADERVATLLLDVSARLHRRGYANDEFNLRLTRHDMGSLLGITLETVSRTLSRFQANGLIETRGKLIQIRDFNRLLAV